MIGNSSRERVVRSDHRQLDLVLLRETRQGRQIAGFDRDVLTELFRAGISRRAKNPVDAGRSPQLPDKCVLAATAADDENFHGNAASLGNETNASCSRPEMTLLLNR